MVSAIQQSTTLDFLAVNGATEPGSSLFALPVRDVMALQSSELLFTPTIDIEDDDSPRTGPAEFRRRGYQRPPDPARMRRIAKFYRVDDRLSSTTPIIVAVRKGLDRPELATAIQVALDKHEEGWKRVLAVIDGQHRLGGVTLAAREAEADAESFDHSVVFHAIHSLTYEEETEVFNVINTTPKRLPKALVEWNRYGIVDRDSRNRDQEIRQIAVQLATDNDSVWNELVNISGTGRDPTRPITLEGLRRSTQNMLTGGVRHLRLERQIELVKMYWRTASEIFESAWNDEQREVWLEDGSRALSGTAYEMADGRIVKIAPVTYRLKDLVGVASLARLGGDILSESLGSPDQEAYIRHELEKIADVDWQKDEGNPWTSGHAGFAGQRGLYEAMSHLRARGIAPWDA